MGSCQTKNGWRNQASNISQNHIPTLEFQVRIWPLNKNINLRDQSTCLSHLLQLQLLPNERKKVELFPKTDKENLPNADRVIKKIKCQVFRKGETFEVDFDQEILKSANDWQLLKQNETCVIGATRYKFYQLVEGSDYKERQILAGTNLMVSAQSLPDAVCKCRICYSSRETEDNPLICPCNCNGSIKYMHLKCLSHWLFGEVEYKDSIYLETKKSICELCKANITQTDAYKSIIGNILSGHHNIAPPFVIFQGSFCKQANETFQNYMVLSFAKKKQYKIGRSHLADVTDKSDLLVSRINTTIAYKENKIWVKDNNSKHGTGIVLNHKLQLSPQTITANLIHCNASIQITYTSKPPQ